VRTKANEKVTRAGFKFPQVAGSRGHSLALDGRVMAGVANSAGSEEHLKQPSVLPQNIRRVGDVIGSTDVLWWVVIFLT
jgi:pantoate kinase